MKLPDDIEVFRIAYGDERAVIKYMILEGANYEEIHQVIYGEDAVLKATREGDRTIVEGGRYGELNFPGGHGTRENFAARRRWLRNQPELFNPESKQYEHPQVGVAKPGLFDRLKRWHGTRRAAQKRAEERHSIGKKLYRGVTHLLSDESLSHQQLMDLLSSMNWTAAEHGAGGFLDEETPDRDPATDPTLTQAIQSVTDNARNNPEPENANAATAPPEPVSDENTEEEPTNTEEIFEHAVEERIEAGDSPEQAVQAVLHSLHDPDYALEMGLAGHHWAYNLGKHGDTETGEADPELSAPAFWNKPSRGWPEIHVGDDGKKIRLKPTADDAEQPPWMEALRERTGTRGAGRRGVGSLSIPTAARALAGHIVGQEGASSLLAPTEDNKFDFTRFYDALGSAKEHFKGDPFKQREMHGIPEGEGKGWPLGRFQFQMGRHPKDWVEQILPAWLDDPRMLQEGYPLHRMGVTPENVGMLKEALGKEAVRLKEEAEKKRRTVGVGNFSAPSTETPATETPATEAPATETPTAEVDRQKIDDIAGEVDAILSGGNQASATDATTPPPVGESEGGMMTTMPCASCTQNVPLTHVEPATGGHICTACATERGLVQASDRRMTLDPFNMAWERLLKGSD